MLKNIFPAFIFIGFSFFSIFGQRTDAERLAQEREKLTQQRRNDEVKARMNRQANEQRELSENRARVLNERDRLRNIYDRRPLSAAEIKAIRAALAPSPADKTRYKSFLEQPNTGLFRLMPNFGCSQARVVRADERCLKSAYIGEYFSFRTEDYSDKDWFDITFKDEKLVSRGFFRREF